MISGFSIHFWSSQFAIGTAMKTVRQVIDYDSPLLHISKGPNPVQTVMNESAAIRERYCPESDSGNEISSLSVIAQQLSYRLALLWSINGKQISARKKQAVPALERSSGTQPQKY
jgi:hypothetical protein